MTTNPTIATTRAADLITIIRETAALPENRAMALPGACYADPDLFAVEQRALLRASWRCVGRADEAPAPGDYVALELSGEPILLIRGADGQLRALSNLCRHRAMPLAEGRGRVDKLICRYHAWSYALDGALRNAPRMPRDRDDTAFDKDACRLPSFPLKIWRGFVYVHLGDDPPPLAPTLAALDARLAAYEPENMRLAHTAEEVWAANWKCLVENFMEGYHLSVVHPQTLHGYTPTALAKKFPGGPGFTGYCANYPENIPERGRGARGLSPEARRRSTLFAAFPAHVASVAASLTVSLALDPIAVDATRVRWTLSVYAGADGDDLSEDVLAERIALWEAVNAEDREKLEQLQRGLGARCAAAGPLAPDDLEGTIHDFQRYLAAAL